MRIRPVETPASEEDDREAIRRAVATGLEEASRTWEATHEGRLSDQIGPMVARVRSDPASDRR